MKNLIRKLLEMGLDLESKDVLKSTLKILGVSEKHVDEIYMELKNTINKENFKRVPSNHRILFLPQCLRDVKNCKAELDGYGYECRNCGRCSIPRIQKAAEKLGYQIFITLGGTMVWKIINEKKPEAVVGVACFKELEMALSEVKKRKIPAQVIPLKKDGCRDTKVDARKVIEIIKL